MYSSAPKHSRRGWRAPAAAAAAIVAWVAIAGLAVMVLGASSASSGCTPARAVKVVMPRIHVVGTRLYAGRKPWRAWGFNWGIGDHQPVIDYLDNPTAANLDVLACELHTAHQLGANSMRIYVELQQVMRSPTATRAATLTALRRVLDLAARENVYVDITGNLVWRPQLAPAWYEQMSEQARWQVQTTFWRAVARTAASSPAVLCYELTSEPVLTEDPGWYTSEFSGWWFGHVIAHPQGRDPNDLARAWTTLLARAVRSQDSRPVTVGLQSNTMEGFTPGSIAGLLDMLVIHRYPDTGRAAEAVASMRHFASFEMPVLLGETYPLWSDLPTQRAFLLASSRYVSGVFEFFDGRDPRRIKVKAATDSLQQQAISQFMTLRKTILAPR